MAGCFGRSWAVATAACVVLAGSLSSASARQQAEQADGGFVIKEPVRKVRSGRHPASEPSRAVSFDDRVGSMPAGPVCRDVSCGRKFVLMLGISY